MAGGRDERPSIQRIAPGGKAAILVTEVEGIKLNGPNDLVFAPDGTLFFTDPGTYNPADPGPQLHLRAGARRHAARRRRLP